MIIQLCGSNGSGKTTVVREIIKAGAPQKTILNGLREYGVVYKFPNVNKPVFIVGKYDGGYATGGCDCIKDVKSIRPIILDNAMLGYHVIFEGIRMMNHTDGVAFCRRTTALEIDTRIILLSTPLHVCIASIKDRQAAAGRDKPVGTSDIQNNVVRARNYASKLGMVGAKVIGASRTEAASVVALLLSRSDE